MPQMQRHLPRSTICATNAIEDERLCHCVIDCPHVHFRGLWQQHVDPEILQDSHDAMRSPIMSVLTQVTQGPEVSLCSCVGHCQ